MAEASIPSQTDLLHRLVRELERRPRVEDPASRRTLDGHLVGLVEQVAAALHRPIRTRTDEQPPKRIASALVLALLSAPHFHATLPRPGRDGTVDPGEPVRRPAEAPPIPSNDVLERTFGLAGWEIDEIREEVDRRAGKALKKVRTVNWLWSFFQLPASGGRPLSRVLLPGTEESQVDLVRRGGHLYLLIDPPQPQPPASLYLPWLAPDPGYGPTAFRSRSVDKGLRNRIARGVGADDDEVAELLEGMVALLPRRDATAFLHLDQWRNHGYAEVTDLGTPYTSGEWLIRPIPADGADWRAWIRLDDDRRPALKGEPEKVFDALALPRVAAMVRLLYAAILASVDREGRLGAEGVRVEDLDLYDLPRHMRAVLAPLMAWAGRATTHKAVAKALGVETQEVADLLDQVRERWIEHAGVSWYGPPGSRAPSIQTLVLEHVIALHQSLRRVMRRAPDPRGDHTEVLLLFCAHYLREARLERLWLKSLSDCVEEPVGKIPPPEDLPGHWFWRAWIRLLDELEREGAGTQF